MSDNREATWRAIPILDGYEASDTGEVRNNLGLVKQYNDRGYRIICANKKNWAVHRLVASAFGLSIEKFIDHIDGNRSNNNLSNLRPATSQENTAYAYKREPKLRGAYRRPSGLFQSKVSTRNNGRQKTYSLGNYKTPEEAALVAAKFRQEMGIV